ncbi:type III secretion system EscT protein [Mycoavidus cysteinexigens]|uniref:Type III secretion system EscT protein n=1 Tax=Mycoavidus cysteinexigens TaxID=1553431 RepID=A0A2Z6ETQ0_9BURK|nr:type III secretion system export apparatus subunit SctT [Mycoavidus cysteinexigens]BBE08758.1 type III secretion system EscT protein [Mycoavidus cysteinexigens]GAM52527.1 type III secretion inner membrane protein [bacterium endosymbiont of Mortierella elongata FMR23-6]GLR01580.1 EscT/YscT/HrcT family type III secretion system export apparatus protein [Mycoavidus cysteinexigens]
MTEYTQWLTALGLCMLRPLGVMLIMPLFNRTTLGGTLIRNALVLMIALPAAAVYAHTPLAKSMTYVHYGLILGSELSIGLMIGFCAAIPFWVIDMAGFLIDTMRGASMASVLNPLLGEQSSLFGILFTQIFSLLFLLTGGFNQLIAAIYQSYVALPPGVSCRFDAAWLTFLSDQWQLMYELCLCFSMPALSIILLVDMALGLINRSAPQLNVFFLSMPIKSGCALLMLIICSNFAYQTLLEHSLSFTARIFTALHSTP